MKKTIYIVTLLVAMTLSACTWLKDFGSTNDNPAATNSPITAALLTNTLSNMGSAWATASLYCQYYSETQYPDVSCYADNQASPMGNYSGALYDLENIIITNTDDATKGGAELYGANANQIAIARILKAYIYWTITDRWGDVPYSEALKGNSTVAFDTQESIYKSLISELTAAVAQFTSGAVIKGDIAYGGDVAKWKKLANSMRMLMALRLSKRYPGASEYAATEFKAALADANGSIATNADNFQLNYPGGAGWRNPFYNMYDGRKDYGLSATVTSICKDTLGGGDTRLTVFGADLNGNYSDLGVPYGHNRTWITDWTNTNTLYAWIFNPTYRAQTSPIYLVKASSVLLARAEAAERGWTTETSSTLYASGITAAFTQWGLTLPAGYLTKSQVALAADGKNLRRIGIQQYLAYFPDGLQGWSNWRRTGVPGLVPAPDGTNTPLVIPRRYRYGTTDYNLNKDAVEAAVALITGGDKMDSRVWWDKP